MRRIGLGLMVTVIALNSLTASAAEARAQLLVQATVVAGCAGIGARMSGTALAAVAMTCDFETPYSAQLVAPTLAGIAMPAVVGLQRGAADAASIGTVAGTARGSTPSTILSIDF